VKPFIHEVTAIVAASPDSRPIIRRYADMITGSPPARIHLTGAAQTAEIQRLAFTEEADLIVIEWAHDPAVMQRLLRLAHELKLPAVFIRPGPVIPIGRLVVATGGGPNVCEQMWIAKEISNGTERPLEILRWHPAAGSGHVSRSFVSEQMLLRLLGIQTNVRHFSDSDFAGGVAGCLCEEDLLIMGAPGSLRWTATFAGSLPDQVAGRVQNPLFLLSSPPGRRVKLRHLFRGGLIKPRMQADSKANALRQLINNLISRNQLPVGREDEIFHRALNREKILSTAVDCGTAFPHVTLPGFFGVTGSMGILPAGVDFGSQDGSLSHFIFLLVTPEGFSDEYLTVLAKIARRMILPRIRQTLLQCETPEQALDVLEPNKKATGDNETPVEEKVSR